MEPDTSDEEITSDYDESVADSEFTSLTSSRLRYTYEHGRRYQGFLQDRYGLPNDDVEQMREGFKHKLYIDYILNGKIFLAPVGNHPQKIVDLGTGVGFWAHDVAEKFPSARVIGTDISPIQPSWSPPNVEFRVEDLEDEMRPWTSIYQDADLIHIRALLPTVRNPSRIIERSFENLRPGGWIEIHEADSIAVSDDDTVDEHHPLNVIYGLIESWWANAYGWDIRITSRIPGMLRDAGFVNVQIKHNRIPVGRWHHESRMREMGIFSQTIVLDWVAAILAKHGSMGLTAEAADGLFQDLTDKINDVSIHCVLDWVDIWAQKPVSHSESSP